MRLFLTRARTRLVTLSALTALAFARPAAAQVPTPEAHFGFQMGADRRLAAMDAIEQYFERVAASSDRVRLAELGPTTEGHRTIAALVSSSDNIARLDQIRDANQQLADPRTMPEDAAPALIASQPVVVAIGCSIHSSEVGATQAASELLYSLATGSDPETASILQHVVLVLIPSLNPDGYRRVVDWYDAHRGTPFEGGPVPGLEHPYAGHDINRDAFMMNLAESRNLARFFYDRWHPQVFLSMHQMGSNGPRFFAPPNADPIYPGYDPVLWREAGLLGSAITLQLAQEGRTGVASNAIYDYYWPGYEDSAPLGHNTVCLLTEAASVLVASPVDVPSGQLKVDAKGLADLTPHINFPAPWPGGHWTLRDIVEYDLSAARGLLQAAARYRVELVGNFYEMGRRAVAAGEQGDPFAFIIPPAQFDPSAAKKLEELLLLGGVEIDHALEPFRADGNPYPAGSDVILLAQPYRAYVKTLLERQRYPPPPSAGEADQPYDVTGWTLPAQMGVAVTTIERWFEAPTMSRLAEADSVPARVWGDNRPSFYVIDARGTAGAAAANRLLGVSKSVSWLANTYAAGGYTYPPGSLVVDESKAVRTVVEALAAEDGLRADGVRGRRPGTAPVSRARIALYKPWADAIDEGWTRWLLEQYGFPFTSVTNADVRAGGLAARFDVLILPSASPRSLLDGLEGGIAPPEYAGGLAGPGLEAIKAFVEAGGTLVCLDQAGALAIDTFDLPVRDVTADVPTADFSGPGSIVRVELDPSAPLAFGMPAETAGFFAFSSAYAIAPGAEDRVSVVARYGSGNPLISGFLRGPDLIAGRPAVVQVSAGEGRVILLGFRVQHRAESLATFRLLFNALLTSR
jgi:Zinc carboxypeptidase